MVKTILEYAVRNVKKPSSPHRREEMKAAGSGLFQALRLAMRLQQVEIGFMIVETLCANKQINDSVNPPLRTIALFMPGGTGIGRKEEKRRISIRICPESMCMLSLLDWLSEREVLGMQNQGG